MAEESPSTSVKSPSSSKMAAESPSSSKIAAESHTPCSSESCYNKTPTWTKQGDEPTCRFHTLSKMVIKALSGDRFKLDDVENFKYKRCMPLETPLTKYNSIKYSIPKCSNGGYVKIMLFYYFFRLAKQLNTDPVGSGIQELLTMPPLKPCINEIEIDESKFVKFKQIADKRPHFGYQVTLDLVVLSHIYNKVILPVLKLGYYLELGLQSTGTDDSVDLDSPVKKDKLPKHMVLIVGTEDGKLRIRNTWKYDENIEPFEDKIVLETESFKPFDLFFILPHNFEEYVYDHTNIEILYESIASIKLPSKDPVKDITSRLSKVGGKKRKTKYGQRRNHYQSKTIRASRKRTKTRYTRRLLKH